MPEPLQGKGGVCHASRLLGFRLLEFAVYYYYYYHHHHDVLSSSTTTCALRAAVSSACSSPGFLRLDEPRTQASPPLYG
ncbi:hypothetical protein VTO42DRAFT_4349 [Malbranchea cinnamomea]